MPCEQPIRIKNNRYKGMSEAELHQYSREIFGTIEPPDLYLDVPCGWCFSCQRKRLSGYNLRLKFEHRLYPDDTYFVTLTFDEASLKKFSLGDNTNKAVRLFLDRYRKKAGKQVRHFFIAEYGERKGRLHYHGLLFNAPINDEKELKDLWKYGIVDVQKADINCTNYLTKYMTKGTDCNKIQPRIIASKGIGLSYVTPENILFHKQSGEFKPFIRIGTAFIPLPRYYIEKIFSVAERLEMTKERFLYKSFEAYLNGRVYKDEIEYRDALAGFLAEQQLRGFTPLKRPPYKKLNKSQSVLKDIKENEFYG